MDLRVFPYEDLQVNVMRVNLSLSFIGHDTGKT